MPSCAMKALLVHAGSWERRCQQGILRRKRAVALGDHGNLMAESGGGNLGAAREDRHVPGFHGHSPAGVNAYECRKAPQHGAVPNDVVQMMR